MLGLFSLRWTIVLVIRREQARILEQAAQARLCRQVLDDLWQSSPHSIQGLGAPEIDQRMADAIRKADGYGLRDGRDFTAFVRLSFVIGPNYDDYPPFQFTLTSAALRPHHRMSQLFEEATSQDWVEAAILDIVSRSRPQRSKREVSVTLVPLRLEHAEEYFRQSLHPDVWRLGSLIPFLRLQDVERQVQDFEAEGP